MRKPDGHKKGKTLSPEDQTRMLRLSEEIKARQHEMALIVTRYLQQGSSLKSYGIPVQEGGVNVGCYDAVNGICYPLDSSGGC